MRLNTTDRRRTTAGIGGPKQRRPRVDFISGTGEVGNRLRWGKDSESFLQCGLQALGVYVDDRAQRFDISVPFLGFCVKSSTGRPTPK